MKKIWIGVVLMGWVLASGVQAQTIAVDERIAPYEKVRGLSGNASSIGSDTMNNMMALWLEAFRKLLSQRQDPDRRQGIEYCAAGPNRRHGSVRADVAAHEVERGGQIRAGLRL